MLVELTQEQATRIAGALSDFSELVSRDDLAGEFAWPDNSDIIQAIMKAEGAPRDNARIIGAVNMGYTVIGAIPTGPHEYVVAAFNPSRRIGFAYITWRVSVEHDGNLRFWAEHSRLSTENEAINNMIRRWEV